MNLQEIKKTKEFVQDKFMKMISAAESSMEKKMLEMELQRTLIKVDQGIDVFQRPDNLNYECIGCGA